MNKKKTIIHVLKNHVIHDRWYEDTNRQFVATCVCGLDFPGKDFVETDDLLAGHTYSMIKKALKKRKLIRKLK